MRDSGKVNWSRQSHHGDDIWGGGQRKVSEELTSQAKANIKLSAADRTEKSTAERESKSQNCQSTGSEAVIYSSRARMG